MNRPALAAVSNLDLRDRPKDVATRLGVGLTAVYAERRRRGIEGHAARAGRKAAYWRSREPALRLAAAAGVLSAAAVMGPEHADSALAHAAHVLGVSRQRAGVLRANVEQAIGKWRQRA
jgi:hypothetical protein